MIVKYSKFIKESNDNLKEEIIESIQKYSSNYNLYKTVPFKYYSYNDSFEAEMDYRDIHNVMPVIYRASKDRGLFYITEKSRVRKQKAGRLPRNKSLNKLLKLNDSWDKYPDRERSIFGSTNQTLPNSFIQKEQNNRLYVMIPFSGSKIGVAPFFDFNVPSSFSHLYDTLSSLSNSYSSRFFTSYSPKLVSKSFDLNGILDSKEKFIECFSDVFWSFVEDHNTPEDKREDIKGCILMDEIFSVKSMGALMDCLYKLEGDKWKIKKDLFDKYGNDINVPGKLYLDLLNADRNGFKVIRNYTENSFLNGNKDNYHSIGNEVWTEDQCLMVDFKIYETILKEGLNN